MEGPGVAGDWPIERGVCLQKFDFFQLSLAILELVDRQLFCCHPPSLSCLSIRLYFFLSASGPGVPCFIC